MVSAVKDPAKVAAGKAGMAARWGVPVRVRLDDFDPNERAAILAAIDARRAAKAVRHEKAPVEIQTPTEAAQEGHVHVRPAA